MAEKRNAAEDICKAIGLKQVRREGKSGFIHGLDEDGSEIVITWSNGHCLELPEPEDIDPKFKSWVLSDLPIPLTSDIDLQIKPEKKTLFYDIKNELKDADDIVNAGDAGREGELIQRWILDLVFKRKGKYPNRLWVQSLTEKSIREAYNNGLLGAREEERTTFNNLYDSGRARAIMDKFIGYNYSRLLSLTQTEGVTVNYGRCQSPLVHAIVERDAEIENFKSIPFSFLSVDFKKDGFLFKGVYVDDQRKRIEKSPEERALLENIIRNHLPDPVQVYDIQRKEMFTTPPGPYDTLQVQKEMAKKYDYEADRTLAIMEKLYDTHHILSYPRTEARHYTEDLRDGLKDTLKALNFGEFKPYVEEALKGFIPDKYFNDGKIADHHALAPVDPGDLEKKYISLSQEEKNVYDAIVKNFIALYLPKYEYETVEILVGNTAYPEKYLVKGKSEKNLGFRALYKSEKKDEEDEKEDFSDQLIPDIKEGEWLNLKDKDSIRIIDSKTKPKSHFTTSSLLDFMKVNNIGTGATRDSIIKELTKRKGHNNDSAVRKEGKYFLATALGKSMDSVIPDSLKSIDQLKYLEGQIQDVADGTLSFQTFIKLMIDDFNKNYMEMKGNTEKKLISQNPNRKTVEGIICPVCKRPLNDVKWGYSCSEWKKDGSGCNFSIGKKLYGKTFSEKVLKQLIEDGQTKSKIKGLKKKDGTAFKSEAFLALEIDSEGKAKVIPKF